MAEFLVIIFNLFSGNFFLVSFLLMLFVFSLDQC